MKMALAALFAALLALSAAVAAADTGVVDPATIPGKYAEDQAEIVLVTAIGTGIDSVNHYIGWYAKHLMEEKSGGRIFNNIYEGGIMGGERETVEGLQSGSIDFVVSISPTFSPFVPRTGVLDLPNSLVSLEVARKVMDSEIVDILAPFYEAAGLKVFGFSDAGFRQTTSSRPLRSIEDFKGLKIRTMENPNHMAYWRALGTNPTPMDFTEVYIALQQGVIDAQENPFDLIVANKFYEPQKYIVETNHFFHNLTMATSKVRFDSFPPDLQEIIVESVKEALRLGRIAADSRIESRKRIVRDYGCEISSMSPELREDILERIAPVYATIAKNVGQDLVDRYLEIIARVEKEVAEGK